MTNPDATTTPDDPLARITRLARVVEAKRYAHEKLAKATRVAKAEWREAVEARDAAVRGLLEVHPLFDGAAAPTDAEKAAAFGAGYLRRSSRLYHWECAGCKAEVPTGTDLPCPGCGGLEHRIVNDETGSEINRVTVKKPRRARAAP